MCEDQILVLILFEVWQTERLRSEFSRAFSSKTHTACLRQDVQLSRSFSGNIEICGESTIAANLILLPSKAAAGGLRCVSRYPSADNTAEYLRDYFLEAG